MTKTSGLLACRKSFVPTPTPPSPLTARATQPRGGLEPPTSGGSAASPLFKWDRRSAEGSPVWRGVIRCELGARARVGQRSLWDLDTNEGRGANRVSGICFEW